MASQDTAIGGEQLGRPEAIVARAPSGGARTRLAPPMARLAGLWHDIGVDATVVLGQQGRLVIPAELRAELGLAPGDQLHLQLTGRRLVLQRQRDAVEELRGLANKVPKTRSLVEELLAERLAAALAE